MPAFTRRPSRAPLTRGRLLTVATAGVLVAGLGVAPSMADDRDASPTTQARAGLANGTTSGYRGRNQTSDGKPGTVVGPPVNLRGKATTANDVSYEIAPGITVREWDQVDGRQPVGQVRMNLVSVSLDAPNVSFGSLSPTYVTSRKKVSEFGAWNGALTATAARSAAPATAGSRA